jgi:hypothetical protein
MRVYCFFEEARDKLRVRRAAAESAEGPKSENPKHVRVDFGFLRQQVSIRNALERLGNWNSMRRAGRSIEAPDRYTTRPRRSSLFSVITQNNGYRCFQRACL